MTKGVGFRGWEGGGLREKKKRCKGKGRGRWEGKKEVVKQQLLKR